MVAMNTNDRMILGVFTLALLLVAQVIFLLIPNELVLLHTHALRPFAYAAALIVIFEFAGRDMRPIPKKRITIMLAGFGAGFYCIGLLVCGLIFGFVGNRLVSGIALFFNHVWIYGTVVIFSEILRHKLIRSTKKNRRNLMAVLVTLVYTFAGLDVLRGFNNIGAADVFFGSILPALALNATLTYIAFRGALPALLLIRVAYTLIPVFLPVLPDVSGVAWSMIECVLLFITAVLYQCGMSDKRLAVRERRREKYRKKSVAGYIVLVSLAVFLIIFNLRVFSYYPAVVLTESMSGAIERGSVVFVKKLSPDDVRDYVKQGDVILFQYGQVEVMHRVIEFRYNAAGERVFITKGDANPNADVYPVEISQVLGISRAYIPYIGYPSVWLNIILR